MNNSFKFCRCKSDGTVDKVTQEYDKKYYDSNTSAIELSRDVFL